MIIINEIVTIGKKKQPTMKFEIRQGNNCHPALCAALRENTAITKQLFVVFPTYKEHSIEIKRQSS